MHARAALVRAAGVTVVGWREWLADLEMAADEGRPLAHMGRELLSAMGWDALPIVQSLARAAELQFDDGPPVDASSAAEVRASLAKGGKGVQRAICQALAPPVCVRPLLLRMRARLSQTLPAQAAGFDVDRLASLCEWMRKKRRGWRAVSLLKTLLCAWATSARMHEAVRLPCPACRAGSDTMSHLLLCQPLWECIGSSLGFGLVPLGVHMLISSSPANLGMHSDAVVCAFASYHSLRRDQRLGDPGVLPPVLLQEHVHAAAHALKALSQRAAPGRRGVPGLRPAPEG